MTQPEKTYAREPNGLRSFEEIGAALGISRARAWQLYHRALKKLRREIGRDAQLRAAVEEMFGEVNFGPKETR